MAKKKITPEQKLEAEKQLSELQHKIDYDTKDFFIPPYQRKFIWASKDKTSFIESVLLGLPIPFMFFGDCEDGRYEIIDGAQRIQTLSAFVEDELCLQY